MNAPHAQHGPEARREVRELRADIAHWRRGRARARLVDVLQDVYVAVFATLMFGAMLTNVVLNVARVSDDLCTSVGCRSGRTALPWLAALATIAIVVALARLFGPVFVSPATASWLLPAPIDRAALLRPRLLAVLGATVTAALPGALAAGLAGFGVAPVVAFSAVLALLCALAVNVVALAQIRGHVHARMASTVAWLPGLLLWCGLVLLATGTATRLDAPVRAGAVWWEALAIAAALALGLTTVALRALPTARDRDLTAGGDLAPSLSGALATLDLALLYDVVLGHAWRRRSSVRSRRGSARGPAALVATDLVRLRRSPGRVGVLALALAVPYAVAAIGAGRVTLLVAGLVAFLAGLPLLVGLRVLTRTPGLLRLLPFPDAEARRLVVRAPATLLLVFGLLTAPALDRALGTSAGGTLGVLAVAAATGVAGLAAGVRWVTGRPPDYARPLVSSPAGAVPTNLYGSALRGFDVLLVTTAPLLLAPDATGATFSLALSVMVLAYLTGRA